jgi:serine/threonine protein kinase
MSAPQKLEKIGRYQVLERVGKGGMGVLYRGFDPVLDREVAIKLMHADFSEDTEQMRPRFYREARAAAKLNHRNIVTIFEFAEESNVPYIVMEFLKGTPLGARMNSQPPLTIDDKLNVVAQLCDGLSYAHEQGVVHRDVKPDNVFILEDGQVKLLDFGIAKLQTSTLTRQGDVLGSASYMSPEQVGGSESVDGRADIFSTGVVLYEMLTGRKPFEGDSPTAVIVKILKDDPNPIDPAATGLPANVIAAVMKALQKDPANRYQTADEMSRDLQNIRKHLHPSASKPNMDETRFASTQVLRALHEDFEKARSGVKPEDADLTRAVVGTPPVASRGWVVQSAATRCSGEARLLHRRPSRRIIHHRLLTLRSSRRPNRRRRRATRRQLPCRHQHRRRRLRYPTRPPHRREVHATRRAHHEVHQRVAMRQSRPRSQHRRQGPRSRSR